MNRREFLVASAAPVVAGSAVVAGGPPVAYAPGSPKKAKSCIFLTLVGGPSQLDTWDPKPAADSGVRSPFRPIATRVPGVQVTELFPKLGAVSHQFSMIRTLHHAAAPVHENGLQLLHTGRRYGDASPRPSLGAIAFGPHVTLDDAGGIDCGVPIDVGQANTRSIPGAGTFAARCLAAAGRVERGGFAYVNMFGTVFDSPTWDCHADGGSLNADLGDYRSSVAPAFDAAFAGLISHLAETGRLAETLVVAAGEFGRTPRRNANGGRDHWPACWTALIGGGGVAGGRVVGTSDRQAAEPHDRPVSCEDFAATVLHALGVSAGLPGVPVRELF